MSQKIRLYELPPSPNNIKARVGLGFKRLQFERDFLAMEGEFPFDRTPIAQVSGQPLTPVLQHGETVIFDSGAILRYLEANFPDSPKLFSTNYAEMKQIEHWEWIGRTAIPEPIGLVFDAAPEPNPEVGEKASNMLHERTAPIEHALRASDFLVGNRLTAADITIVPFVRYGMLEDPGPDNAIRRYFYTHLKLGEGRERTRAWVNRVLEFDPHAD